MLALPSLLRRMFLSLRSRWTRWVVCVCKYLRQVAISRQSCSCFCRLSVPLFSAKKWRRSSAILSITRNGPSASRYAPRKFTKWGWLSFSIQGHSFSNDRTMYSSPSASRSSKCILFTATRYTLSSYNDEGTPRHPTMMRYTLSSYNDEVHPVILQWWRYTLSSYNDDGTPRHPTMMKVHSVILQWWRYTPSSYNDDGTPRHPTMMKVHPSPYNEGTPCHPTIMRYTLSFYNDEGTTVTLQWRYTLSSYNYEVHPVILQWWRYTLTSYNDEGSLMHAAVVPIFEWNIIR